MTDDDMRAWRTELGLNQAEAALKLGISLSALQKYERPGLNKKGIPEPVALACAAVKAGIGPYRAPSELKQIEVHGADGRIIRQTGVAKRKLQAARRGPGPSEEVCARIAEVARLQAEGKRLREISEALGISVSYAHALAKKARKADPLIEEEA